MSALTKQEIIDNRPFQPDWADFKNGCDIGRLEAFGEIAAKIRAMPFENDTKDSLLIWLWEQK